MKRYTAKVLLTFRIGFDAHDYKEAVIMMSQVRQSIVKDFTSENWSDVKVTAKVKEI
jgi:hypothetical protein